MCRREVCDRESRFSGFHGRPGTAECLCLGPARLRDPEEFLKRHLGSVAVTVSSDISGAVLFVQAVTCLGGHRREGLLRNPWPGGSCLGSRLLRVSLLASSPHRQDTGKPSPTLRPPRLQVYFSPRLASRRVLGGAVFRKSDCQFFGGFKGYSSLLQVSLHPQSQRAP